MSEQIQPDAAHRERIILYAMLTSLTAISIDAVLPGLRAIEADLGLSPPLSTHHVISLFIFGMVFGELVLGPLSDSIGRKKALLLGLSVYVAGTIIALLAGSIETLVLGRFLQGAGVAGPKIATRAMIRDQYEGDAMARVMSFMFTLLILVPMVAPFLGQAILLAGGWRSIFGGYLVLAFVLAVWLVVRQPETLLPQRRVSITAGKLLRNTGRILACRRVSLIIVATGLVFGAQLLFLSTSVDLFHDAYGITTGFPIFFAIFAAATGLAAFCNGTLVLRFGMDRMARAGFVGLTAAGLLMLVASWLSGGRPPLAVFMGLGFVGFFAIGVLFGNLNAMAMRSLGQVAGLGASLIASGSSLVATAFTLCLGAFYDGTILYLATGFALSGAVSLTLSEIATRGDVSPVTGIH
ncbi:multidrug effflux MFS transporter [Primorskyibacter flagellatus]|uniref:MFS transporter, DHA1 family, bicyclomycin/chloramphenicol resistance protein n=1 Tax=Primorskyibacter flagellatus TaxID=1387277 RepID=A0A1W2BY76_9RHOB|nr:multidrug effflux MFS transporter [Primorskyibacter flagellatus]SMC77694.1 MFS transporter, DHA1 family, bicyclomycin/chloramphenicol resistance protein [Primorskyibacter flagellatus]